MTSPDSPPITKPQAEKKKKKKNRVSIEANLQNDAPQLISDDTR